MREIKHNLILIQLDSGHGHIPSFENSEDQDQLASGNTVPHTDIFVHHKVNPVSYFM